MKKSIVFIFVVMLAITGFAQKNSTCVVMYFKADLACCKARACASLENDVKSVVEKNFTNGDVIFKEIRISDPDNASLVEQYKAQSQTVIVVTNKKKKFTSVDATPLVKDYVKSQDKTGFETAFVKLIADSMK